MGVFRRRRAKRPNAWWSARFTQFGVMHSGAHESLNVLRDPHVEATGMFSHLIQPGLAAKMPVPSIPGVPALEDGTPRAAAPLAGGDTEAVLTAHGYSEAEIADLRARYRFGRGRTIAMPAPKTKRRSVLGTNPVKEETERDENHFSHRSDAYHDVCTFNWRRKSRLS